MPLIWDGSWLGDGTEISCPRLSLRMSVSRLTAEGACEVVAPSLAE